MGSRDCAVVWCMVVVSAIVVVVNRCVGAGGLCGVLVLLLGGALGCT